MERVDELFGAQGGQPRPRRRLTLLLLSVGLVLSALGMACTAAPGGLIVLGAWWVVEADMDRVDSGFLPAEAGVDVRRDRNLVLGGLGFVLALFIVQGILLAMGFYEKLWAGALTMLLPATAPAPP